MSNTDLKINDFCKVINQINYSKFLRILYLDDNDFSYDKSNWIQKYKLKNSQKKFSLNKSLKILSLQNCQFNKFMEIDKNIKTQQLRRKSSIVYGEVKNLPISSDSDLGDVKIKEMSFGESDKD